MTQDTGVALIGTYQILTCVLLTIEAFYYKVFFSTGPATFLVLLYAGWCVAFVLHRTGDGIRDSYSWRIGVFHSFVVIICILVKIFWLLFMLQLWSDYGAMVCSKS